MLDGRNPARALRYRPGAEVSRPHTTSLRGYGYPPLPPGMRPLWVVVGCIRGTISVVESVHIFGEGTGCGG